MTGTSVTVGTIDLWCGGDMRQEQNNNVMRSGCKGQTWQWQPMLAEWHRLAVGDLVGVGCGESACVVSLVRHVEATTRLCEWSVLKVRVCCECLFG